MAGRVGGNDGYEFPEDSETVATTFDLLGDERARDIIRLLSETDEPLSTDAIADRLDIPDSTAYRKLSELSRTPLVVKQTGFDGSGHHRSEYDVTVDDVVVRVNGGSETSLGLLVGQDTDD